MKTYHLHSLARISGKPAWRVAEFADGESFTPAKKSYKTQQAGDIFTCKKGKTWIRYTKVDGQLGVKPYNQ